MGLFERYLTIWVAICIVAGLFLGNLFLQDFQVFASLEIAHVNVPGAISLFGLNSAAALATVVGVLVEVSVMLTLVAFANRTRHWFEAN